jgi:hypothetical protein
MICSIVFQTLYFSSSKQPYSTSGDQAMNHSSTQYQNAPVTFSVMISEVVYKAVIGVERMIRRLSK